jgi:hypothetical protein
MCRRRGRHKLDDAKAQRAQAQVGKQRFATTQRHWCKGQVHLVDQPGPQVLPDRRDAAPDLRVLAACGGLRTVQRRLDAVGHEVKGGAAFEFDRRVRGPGGRRAAKAEWLCGVNSSVLENKPEEANAWSQ